MTEPDRRRGRRSIAAQVTLAGVVVAVVATVVVGVLAVQAVTTTARDVAQQTLADQADVVQSQVLDERLGSRLVSRRLAEVLQGQGIAIVTVGPAGRLNGVDPQAVAAADDAGAAGVAADASTSTSVDVGGSTLLVEARPTDGGGFALVQATSTTAVSDAKLGRRLLLALAIGLVAAAVTGALLARRLTRPLRRIADQARRIGTGQRDVRLPVDGPLEVADVGTAVNDLNDALRESEARQQEFFMSVSHDLRTPLTVVRGYAESLADGVVAGDAVPAAGATIQREAERLERMVGDLLDLARLGADDVQLDVMQVNLTALAAETVDAWRPRCDTLGLDLRLETPAHDVIVTADPRRLRQVVDGLLDNATRASPAGRPIVVAVVGDDAVAIRDGGPGLSAEDRDIAFERGALHARYLGSRPVGTGIGLSLARGLMTRMGGTMDVTSAPEGGACFTIHLPTSM